MMSEAQTELAKVAEQPTVVQVGEVSIEGVHLIGERMFDILQHILSLKTDFGVKLILFTEDQVKNTKGEELLGCSYPETDSIRISLQKHIDNAYKVCFYNDCDMSFSAYLWYNTLKTVCHEVYHIWNRNTADDKTEEIEGEEEAATEWANETITHLAKTIAIEPSSPEALPFYGAKILEFRELLSDAGKEDDNLLKQRFMFDNGMVWSDESMNIFTLKEFCRIVSDDSEDPSWNSEEVSIRFVEKGTKKETTPGIHFENVYEAVPPAPEDTPTAKPVAKSTIVDTILKDQAVPVNFTQDELDEYDSEYVDPDYSYGGPSDPIDALPTETKVSIAFGNAPPPPSSSEVSTAQDVLGVLSDNSTAPTPPTAPIGAMRAPAPTNDGLNMEDINSIVRNVFSRLYLHIFTKCEFQPENTEKPFKNPYAVFDPVSINDISNVHKVFKTMDTQDVSGTWAPGIPINGHIKGQVFKKSGLPGYTVYLNVNGKIMKRLIIPQNVNTGSRPALASKNGACIAWVIDGLEDTGKQYKVKIHTHSTEFLGMPPYGSTFYEVL